MALSTIYLEPGKEGALLTRIFSSSKGDANVCSPIISNKPKHYPPLKAAIYLYYSLSFTLYLPLLSLDVLLVEWKLPRWPAHAIQ